MFTFSGQGNYRTHLTLPNILKEFNPRLIGYRELLKTKCFTENYGNSFIFRFSWRDASSMDPGAVFNMAEDVALISDMPYMAYQLLRRMRLDRR